MTTEPEKQIALSCQFFIYLSFGMLILVGKTRDLIDNLFEYFSKLNNRYSRTKTTKLAPITHESESFFRRRLYGRVLDCFNRPIRGPAGGRVRVIDRDMKTLEFKKEINCLNLASYNYLGFATPGHKMCEPNVMRALNKYGISTCSSPLFAGTTSIHDELEKYVSTFLNVADCMVFGMGWGTNCTAIPSLVGKGCLIVSDSINHNSIVAGARSSGAVIKTFKHNDTVLLEKVIRRAIIDGQPKTHRAWKKILIIVEGVYSMEGEMCDLAAIVEIKKKYKCYLYLDEAHSMGAVGKHGRGICDYQNVNTQDVDILMGTFTKSFGAIGGYVAGSHDVISKIRLYCASSIFSSGLSPVCAAQVLSAFKVIDSEEGKKRIARLVQNSDYVRKQLIDKGFLVVGSYGSAVVPFIVGHPAKCPAFARLLLENGIACVIVGFPATPLLSSRVRLCISASHTKEDLDKACQIIDQVGDIVHLKYKLRTMG